MNIKKIVIRQLKMKLKNPLRNRLTTISHKHFLILEIHDEQGHIGYGESVAFTEPWYTEETTQTVLYILKEFLIPLTKTASFSHPENAAEHFVGIKRNRMAKATIESALWDLYAKQLNVSLQTVFNGSKTFVPAGISLGIEPTINELLHNIQTYVEQGYKRIKLKIQPGWDIEMLEAVREKFPNVPLMVDANGAYTESSSHIIKQLDNFQLQMIEQPFEENDWLAYLNVKNQLKTPICLDESIDSYASAQLAIHLGIADILTLKIGRVGGITESLKIRELAEQQDIPLWIGGMFETGIGRALNVAFASHSAFSLPGDIGESDHYWYEDLIQEPITITKGSVFVPQKPGIGVEINQEILEYTTVHKETIWF